MEARLVQSSLATGSTPAGTAVAHAALVGHPDATKTPKQPSQGSSTHGSGTHAGSGGFVTKAPVFNELYVGPKLPQLNARAARVEFVPGRGLVFTGVLQGRIHQNPGSLGLQSYYVFGVDRGSPNAVAPIPNRPNIFVDALVTVSILQGGASASVQDLVRPSNSTVLFLPPQDLKLHGHKLQVTVDPAYLPTPDGGLPLSLYQYNFTPASNLLDTSSVSTASFLASFLPETSESAVVVPKGFKG
jgi:hypothetical protein